MEKSTMKKSIIPQIRDEMETYVVGWNLSSDKEVRVVEYPDPKSSKYTFSIRYRGAHWGNILFFDFMRPNGDIFVRINSRDVGDENIEWLTERYKFIERKLNHVRYLDSNSESIERHDLEYLFKLNKPSDVYDILVKIQSCYFKKSDYAQYFQ